MGWRYAYWDVVSMEIFYLGMAKVILPTRTGAG